jgi:hypothetical protein
MLRCLGRIAKLDVPTVIYIAIFSKAFKTSNCPDDTTLWEWVKSQLQGQSKVRLYDYGMRHETPSSKGATDHY